MKKWLLLISVILISNVVNVNNLLAQDQQEFREVQIEPAQILAQVANWMLIAPVIDAPLDVNVEDGNFDLNVFLDDLRVRATTIRNFIRDYVAEQFDQPLVPGMPGRFVINLDVQETWRVEDFMQSILNHLNHAIELQNNWQPGENNPMVALLGLDVLTGEIWAWLDNISDHLQEPL